MHARGPVRVAESTQSTEDNGSGVFEHMARNSIIDDVTNCRMQILQFFFFLSTEFLRGMVGRQLWLHHCGSTPGRSCQQPGGDTQDTYCTCTLSCLGRISHVVGFLLSPLSSNGIAFTHRRDRRDAPMDLLSSPHIYHHRDRNR